jgi:predicted DNA-binding transcriptional regulator YafY
MKDNLNLQRLARVMALITYQSLSKEAVMDQLSEAELRISDRTFARIIKQIRDLGFEVEYIPDIGYRIVDQVRINEDYATMLSINTLWTRQSRLERLKTGDSDDLIRTDLYSRGLRMLPVVLQAMNNSQKISIVYQEYGSLDTFEGTVSPLKLAEADYRWYVYAYDEGSSSLKLFGLDRILNLSLGKRYNSDEIPRGVKEALNLNQFKLGVKSSIFPNYPGQVMDVTLAVSDYSLPFLIDRPFIHTQEITNKKIGAYNEVKLRIIPTRDLIKKVAATLGDIKIAGPQELTDYVRKEYPAFADAILSI